MLKSLRCRCNPENTGGGQHKGPAFARVGKNQFKGDGMETLA
jgi:hypothetical protein